MQHTDEPALVPIGRDLYEFGMRTSLAGTTYSLQSAPVTVSTFCNFLNDLGHRESQESPVLVNLINPECQLGCLDGVWVPKQGQADSPVVLITYTASVRMAETYGVDLISEPAWRVAAAIHWPDTRGPKAGMDLNMEDHRNGPVPVSYLAGCCPGHHGLIGNVSYWGAPVDCEFAWVFGSGWNKPIPSSPVQTKRMSPRFEASASTGLRFMMGM